MEVYFNNYKESVNIQYNHGILNSKNLTILLIATIASGILASILLGKYITPTSGYIAAGGFGLTGLVIGCCLYKNRKVSVGAISNIPKEIKIPKSEFTIASTNNEEQDIKVNESERNSFQTVLQDIKITHFASILKEILAKTLNEYISNSQTTNSNCVWNISVLQLLQEAIYDDTSCDASIIWPNTNIKAYNHFSTKLKNGKIIYREDIINQSTCGNIDTVSIWENLKNLNPKDLRQVRLALEDSTQKVKLDPKVSIVAIGIKAIAEQIKNRYPFDVSVEMNRIIYFSHADPVLSAKNIVQNSLRNLLISLDAPLSKLAEGKFSSKVCGLIVLELLNGAKVEDSLLTLKNGLVLDFTRLGSENDIVENSCLKFINLFKVNELNSNNYTEVPYIGDEPLLLAESLRDQELFNDIENNIKLNKKPFSGIHVKQEVSDAFENFSKFIHKKFYVDFCGSLYQLAKRDTVVVSNKLVNDLNSAVIVDPKNQSSQKEFDEKETVSSSNYTVIHNDQHGDLLKKYIEHEFKIGTSWSQSGSCVLSCFFPEFESDTKRGYEKIGELRASIASYIESHMKEYMQFVMVITNYNKLPLFEKVQLKEEHWVISCDDSIASKEAAIKERCVEITKEETYLTDAEIGVIPEILKRPIWVYKRLAGKIFLDKKGKLLPHVKYGDHYKKPYYLYDDYNHYKPLKPRGRFW